MFDLCEHRSSWNFVYRESSHEPARTSCAKPQRALCILNLERNTQMCHEHRVSSKAPCLHHVVAAISHLRCQPPPTVSGLWVQSGDGTPDGDVQWPYRDAWNPGAPSVPPKLFLRLPRRRYSGTKWARVGRPHCRTRARRL